MRIVPQKEIMEQFHACVNQDSFQPNLGTRAQIRLFWASALTIGLN